MKNYVTHFLKVLSTFEIFLRFHFDFLFCKYILRILKPSTRSKVHSFHESVICILFQYVSLHMFCLKISLITIIIIKIIMIVKVNGFLKNRFGMYNYYYHYHTQQYIRFIEPELFVLFIFLFFTFVMANTIYTFIYNKKDKENTKLCCFLHFHLLL